MPFVAAFKPFFQKVLESGHINSSVWRKLDKNSTHFCWRTVGRWCMEVLDLAQRRGMTRHDSPRPWILFKRNGVEECFTLCPHCHQSSRHVWMFLFLTLGKNSSRDGEGRRFIRAVHTGGVKELLRRLHWNRSLMGSLEIITKEN